MAVPYPTGLPYPLISGYGYQEQNDNVSVLETVSCLERRRPLNSFSSHYFEVSFVLEDDLLTEWENWFRYSLSNGSSWFEMELETGIGLSLHEGRFTKEGYSVNKSGTGWIVRARIETKEKGILAEAVLDSLLGNTKESEVPYSTFPITLPAASVNYSYKKKDSSFYFEEGNGFNSYKIANHQNLLVINVSWFFTSEELAVFEAWYYHRIFRGNGKFIHPLYIQGIFTDRLSFFREKPSVKKNGLIWTVSATLESDFFVPVSVEDFTDIIFWDGFEGEVLGGVYTATSNSWTPSHTFEVPSDDVLVTPGLVGTKSLAVLVDTDPIRIGFGPMSSNKGRIGFNWKFMGSDPIGTSLITITKNPWIQ